MASDDHAIAKAAGLLKEVLDKSRERFLFSDSMNNKIENAHWDLTAILTERQNKALSKLECLQQLNRIENNDIDKQLELAIDNHEAQMRAGDVPGQTYLVFRPCADCGKDCGFLNTSDATLCGQCSNPARAEKVAELAQGLATVAGGFTEQIAANDELQLALLSGLVGGMGKSGAIEFARRQIDGLTKAAAEAGFDILVRDGHVEKVDRVWKVAESGVRVLSGVKDGGSDLENLDRNMEGSEVPELEPGIKSDLEVDNAQEQARTPEAQDQEVPSSLFEPFDKAIAGEY